MIMAKYNAILVGAFIYGSVSGSLLTSGNDKYI